MQQSLNDLPADAFRLKSAARICTTLGFSPWVAARIALKSRSWVSTTYPLTLA
jgi:hypothetical protein